VDDFGRDYAHPRRVKAKVVPMRDDFTVDDIKECLVEIEEKKLIVLYYAEGDYFLQLTKFDQNQSGLHKRTKSKLPPPEAASNKDSGKFREIPGNSRPTEEKRREENRRDYRTLPEGKVMSGKPDVDPQKSNSETPKNREIKNQAIAILNFLNMKAGKNFRPVDANLKLIVARLKAGATVLDCRKVIVTRTREWKGKENMAEYLRPKTLFAATNFEQYVGEIVPVEENV
jgi:uncharacterized phage protein (TIGR02220 family)